MHNICVVGYGGMGGWHVFYITHDLTDVLHLSGIVDIRPEREEEARKNGIHVYDSFEQMLEDPSVDIVLLAIPNNLAQALCRARYESRKKCYLRKTGYLERTGIP